MNTIISTAFFTRIDWQTRGISATSTNSPQRESSRRLMLEGVAIGVVTGGGHGIGRALCRRLHREGVQVVVADIDAAAARKVAAEINGIAKCVDVGDETQVAQLIDAVEQDVGPIDLFVSNAGVGFGDADDSAASAAGGMHPIEDRWDACWRINVLAHVYAARVLVPRMTARGRGYLVNVASAAGLLAQIGDAAYTATKHAAVGFAQSLAITHGDSGIRVSVVCPQAVATRMIGIEDDSDSHEGGFGGNEVDGILSADEVAECVVAGLVEGRFLILPHEQVATYVQRKAADQDRWIGGMQRFRRRLADRND
jgi:NAD(P)-dependent dehydrogenase (short-subunit alcohol dehydrogenase family)